MSTNSSKSISSVFIYIIIKREGSEDSPIAKKSIQEQLSSKYNITIDNKTLARILSTLEDANLNIERNTGGWYAA